MLSAKDNEMLTKIGPGTPMGDLFRQYWLPVLLADELPEADGAPLRVRLLGEDLVAIRDTNGEVGLLAEACPHRGASTYYGRNELGGLRCVYHGWKFDIHGRCLDMPSEPEESNFKDKIRQTAYPCVDRNGVILATSLNTASLYANPRHVLDPRDAAEKLSRVLPELRPAEVLAKLTSGRSFVWIKRHLTPRQHYAVNRQGLPGPAE